jgi:hypothetical protein
MPGWSPCRSGLGCRDGTWISPDWIWGQSSPNSRAVPPRSGQDPKPRRHRRRRVAAQWTQVRPEDLPAPVIPERAALVEKRRGLSIGCRDSAVPEPGDRHRHGRRRRSARMPRALCLERPATPSPRECLRPAWSPATQARWDLPGRGPQHQRASCLGCQGPDRACPFVEKPQLCEAPALKHGLIRAPSPRLSIPSSAAGLAVHGKLGLASLQLPDLELRETADAGPTGRAAP